MKKQHQILRTHIQQFSICCSGVTSSKANTYNSNYENNQQDALYRLTLRRLMSYIYMEHPFLMFLDHTKRRSTVGRTDSSARVISSSQRPLPDNTRHSQQTNIQGDVFAHNQEQIWNNKLIYIVHLVGYFHSCITMYGFMNVKLKKIHFCTYLLIMFEYISYYSHCYLELIQCLLKN